MQAASPSLARRGEPIAAPVPFPRMSEQARAENQDGRQAQADGPTDISASGWMGIAKQTWAESGKDNLNLVASGIAFNGFLAIFPLLTAVVLGYGLVASPGQVAQHIAMLTQSLPQDAASLIGDQLKNMVQSSSAATGIGVVVTLAVAIYGAMRGASGIITGLNIIYDIKESRSFVWQTLTALAITLGAILLFIVASVAISLVNSISALLPQLGGTVHQILQIGFWFAAAAAVSLVVAAIYAYAPNREEPEWRWLSPGAIVATVVWVIATFAFSFYVSNFGNYNATYGALGAVIIFLTWLYLSAYILMFGAELNQVLERRARAERQQG